MATLNEIEMKAQTYAASREALAGTLMALEDETRALKRKYLARIRKLVETAKAQRADLAAAIDASPALFVKPRTQILHGVKCGFAKAKGRIEWDNEEAVVARIRKLLPADQAELLIRVKESVHKPAVYDLAASDLKRLGIRVEGDGDEVVIKDAAGEVDKLVEALLKDETEGAGA